MKRKERRTESKRKKKKKKLANIKLKHQATTVQMSHRYIPSPRLRARTHISDCRNTPQLIDFHGLVGSTTEKSNRLKSCTTH